MILVIEVLFLPFRWYCGGTWHVCGVLPRSQGSHGFVPWQGLWNWGPGFSSTPSWSWLSARSSCCCFFRYSKGLSLLLFWFSYLTEHCSIFHPSKKHFLFLHFVFYISQMLGELPVADKLWQYLKSSEEAFSRMMLTLWVPLDTHVHKRCNAFPQETLWACAMESNSDKLPMKHVTESLFPEIYRKCSSPSIS